MSVIDRGRDRVAQANVVRDLVGQSDHQRERSSTRRALLQSMIFRNGDCSTGWPAPGAASAVISKAVAGGVDEVGQDQHVLVGEWFGARHARGQAHQRPEMSPAVGGEFRIAAGCCAFACDGGAQARFGGRRSRSSRRAAADA